MKILDIKAGEGVQPLRGSILLAAALLLCRSALSQDAPPSPAKNKLSTAEAVTVTTRSESPLGETARTSYTLSPEDLQDYPAITLDESLRQHAGFELFRRAPSRVANPTSEGISLRGLGSTAASRTLVLEDGAPLNDPFGGYIHWDEQPAASVRSVTLVTGGGSDLYGSSALGGVIDLTPETPALTHLELSGLGGSQSTSDLQALGTLAGKAGSLLLAGQSIRTAGYIVTNPAIAGSVDVPANVRSQSYRAELGRRELATKRLFLTGNLLNEDRSNGTPLQTNATRFWRYLGGYDLPATDLFSGKARVFGSQQGYRQSFSSIAANRNSEALTRLQRVHTQEFGASADATLHHASFAVVGGADLRDIRATDNETPISKGLPSGFQGVTARQRFVGGFVEALGSHNGWAGAASMRVDSAENLDIVQSTVSAVTRTQNRTELVFSPRLGLTRSLGPLAGLHASGFRAFRTPTMNELYRTGQVGQEITQANAALQSERATGFEAGTDLHTRTSAASLQATYFWTEINRPVSAVLIAPNTNLRENLGQIRSQGAELALTLFRDRPLSAAAGYQYADSIVTKFSAQPALIGNWIPQVPRQSFTAQVHGSSQRFGEVTVAARAIGQSYDDAANQFSLARFFALDLSGRHAFNQHLEATFLVQNLTDRRPQVSRTPNLTLGSPIFAQAGLNLRFGSAP